MFEEEDIYLRLRRKQTYLKDKMKRWAAMNDEDVQQWYRQWQVVLSLTSPRPPVLNAVNWTQAEELDCV